MDELDLFAVAIAIVDPAERAAFLDRECAGRSDLRHRLDLLLEAHPVGVRSCLARRNPCGELTRLWRQSGLHAAA